MARTLRACGAYTAALTAGIAAAVQGGVNSTLAHVLTSASPHASPRGGRVSGALLAATVSFGGGVLALCVINGLQLGRRCRTPGCRKPERLIDCAGGVLGSTVVVLLLLTLPLTGFALSQVLSATGTNCTCLVLDHSGFLGSHAIPLSRSRIIGAICMLAGSLLSAWEPLRLELGRDSGGDSAMGLLGISAIPLLAGALFALQGAVNGRLGRRLHAPLLATHVSFVGGLGCLTVASVAVCGGPTAEHARALRSALSFHAYHSPEDELKQEDANEEAIEGYPSPYPSPYGRPPAAAPWQLCGGLLGTFVISVHVVAPSLIGFAANSAFVMTGNLFASVLLDSFGAFGFAARPPTVVRFAGVCLALAGALLTRRRAPRGGPLLSAAVRRVDGGEGKNRPSNEVEGVELSRHGHNKT